MGDLLLTAKALPSFYLISIVADWLLPSPSAAVSIFKRRGLHREVLDDVFAFVWCQAMSGD
jgi:hypothetical protein